MKHIFTGEVNSPLTFAEFNAFVTSVLVPKETAAPAGAKPNPIETLMKYVGGLALSTLVRCQKETLTLVMGELETVFSDKYGSDMDRLRMLRMTRAPTFRDRIRDVRGLNLY